MHLEKDNWDCGTFNLILKSDFGITPERLFTFPIKRGNYEVARNYQQDIIKYISAGYISRAVHQMPDKVVRAKFAELFGLELDS